MSDADDKDFELRAPYVQKILELEHQLTAMTAERDCWISNAKALQVGYNELDARLRNRDHCTACGGTGKVLDGETCVFCEEK